LGKTWRILGSRGRAASVLALLAVAPTGALVSGCAGTTLRGDIQSQPVAGAKPQSTSTRSSTSQRAEYVRALEGEQAKLAAAERAIPRNARTPVELSRSTRLLASAIRRLGAGLAAITPPPEVASHHARLVSIVRAYELALGRAARVAVRPGGELRAGNMLISATTAASSAFASTVAAINAKLR